MKATPAACELSWIKQWAAAAGPLAAERRRALAALTDSEVAAAALALLDLAARLPPDPSRRSTSGLVEQQARLHQRQMP